MKKFIEKYISEMVYGGIDGIVTTFAVVSAAAGASLSSTIVIIMGVANLIADGISMGVSAYLSERAEVDTYKKQRNGVVLLLESKLSSATTTVKKHLKHYGFSGALLETATKTILSSNGSENAVDFIMKEEHGLADEPKNARMTGFITSSAFLAVGIVPLIAYLLDGIFDLNLNNIFLITCVLAGFAFGMVGWAKSRVTRSSVVISVIETLMLGLIAAGAAYGIGYWLNAIFGV